MTCAAKAKKCTRLRQSTSCVRVSREIDLVNHCSALQCQARTLVAHLASRLALQLRVYQRHEQIERGLVTLAPRLEQAGNINGIGQGHHASSSASSLPCTDIERPSSAASRLRSPLFYRPRVCSLRLLRRAKMPVTAHLHSLNERRSAPVTPERWQQVARIYQLAADEDPAARDGCLSDACAGDEALRRDVESLLRQDDA